MRKKAPISNIFIFNFSFHPGENSRSKGINGGLESLEKVEQILIKQGMKKEKIDAYTLDLDATGIEPEKESAKMTNKG